MPVRNGGKLLPAALRSVLDQTEQDFELIVSDNGSDDGSSEILRRLAADDPRVSYFRQDPVIRAYDNFRFVLERARGEFFMWAAHDDTRDLDFVERLMSVLNKNKDAVLAFGDLNLITPTDPLGTPYPFPFETKGMGTKTVTNGMTKPCPLFPHNSTLWHGQRLAEASKLVACDLLLCPNYFCGRCASPPLPLPR
jgi:glycosyltransferase involved in cell wall biosynthesis